MNTSAPAPTAPAPTPELSHAERARVDQATLLQGNVVGLMLGNAAATVMAVLMLRHVAPAWALWPWVALQLANVAFNLWAGRRVGRRPATPRNAGRRLQAAARASTVSGLLWAAGVLVLWEPGDFESQLMLIFLITGLSASALYALNAHLPAFRGFFLPCVLSALVMMLTEGTLRGAIVAVMAATYCVTSWRFASRMHGTLVDSLKRRHEVEDLAADLGRQKDLAEQASQSKSRFLAAASHDLRQPVHAMSLFVGALGERPLEPEARRLVGHLQGSIHAMGALFNGLLDISRLDAGMVAPQPRPVALKPLLDRVATEEGVTAAAKGLRLRLNAADVDVQTDPVLLERVLRNLVHNAVRYTDRGGVLVSARRRGDAVVVRVLDTGIGIAPERQGEVFQEFVQLHNPGRDRSQGLGLGLAIVRRLADLLGVPLALRSVPGRGTAFTLRLALARSAVPSPAPEAAPAVDASVPAPTGLVLVVDDDADIRVAMAGLLRGWGCEVIDAAGMADLQPQLMAVSKAPGLVICDHRLHGGETGLDVVAQLHELFNEDLPVILITGDTGPDRLQAAQVSGYRLLHKPVTPAALRQAMAQVTSASAEPA